MFHIFVANFDRPLCEQPKGNPKVILTPADKLKKVKNGLLSYFQILAQIIPHIVSSMRQQKMYICCHRFLNEDLDPKIEKFFSLSFEGCDILELRRVDRNQ